MCLNLCCAHVSVQQHVWLMRFRFRQLIGSLTAGLGNPTHLYCFYHSHTTLSYQKKKKHVCPVSLLIPKEAGGEARSTDKAAREARPSGHQQGPAGRPGVAQRPPNEGDNCELTVLSLSEHKTQP